MKKVIAITTILLLILAMMLAVSSCSSNYYLKRAKKNIAKAIEKGAKVDSVSTVIRDTVTITKIVDTVVKVAEVDTVIVKQLCPEVYKNKVKTSALQKAVCPKIDIDSVYTIKFNVQGNTYYLPVHVAINSEGGRFNYSIVGGELKVPFIKKQTDIVLKPGKVLTWWDLIGAVAVALVLGFILGKIIKLG